jgi:hypothetical protein
MRECEMTDLRQAAQQALEALLSVNSHGWDEDTHTGRALITALRKALEQPEQEPGAKWIIEEDNPDSFAKHPAFQPAAQPEQQAEPVAQQYAKLAQHCTMLEHKLAQRKPLTDAVINNAIEAADTLWADADVPIGWARHFARAIEAAHGIKERNT